MFKNCLWFLSGFCSVLLFLPGFQGAWIVLLIAATLLLWLTLADTPGKSLGFSHRWIPNLLALFFLLLSGLVFYLRWQPALDWRLILAITFGLCFVSSYFVFTIFGKIFSRNWGSTLSPPKKRNLDPRSCLFVFLGVCILTTICAYTSFLYPLNPSATANELMSGGRIILSEHLMYQDIYGSGGPILYFVHGLSWLLFHNFTGIYLLEMILDTLFFVYFLKTVGLFFNVNKLLMAFPIVLLVFYTSKAYVNGDAREEFCLFFLMACLYILMQQMRTRRTPSFEAFFGAGLCIGVVLWSQYSVIGFFAGFLLIPLVTILLKRNWKKFFLSLLCLAAGTALISLPVLLHFWRLNTLDAMLNAYFRDPFIVPVAYGSPVLGVLLQIGKGLLSDLTANPILYIQTFMSFICALRLGRRYFWPMFLCFCSLITFQYGFFTLYEGSALLWNVFGCFALILYYQAYEGLELVYFRQSFIRLWTLLMVVIAAYFMSGANVMMNVKTEKFAQKQAADIFSQKDNASVLTYNMPDRGFYTYADILPTTKYYAASFRDANQEVEEQEKLIEKGVSDFVISSERLDPLLANQGGYALIKTFNQFSTPDHQDYYLYTRKDLLNKLSY